MNPAIVMHLAGSNLCVIVLQAPRIEKIGIGSYLKKIKPGEILISVAALQAIETGCYQTGIRPMEVFDDRTVAWCVPIFPVGQVSVHAGAKEWFRGVCTVDDAQAQAAVTGKPIKGQTNEKTKRRKTNCAGTAKTRRPTPKR